jgi:hypothetical protein
MPQLVTESLMVYFPRVIKYRTLGGESGVLIHGVILM